MVAVMSGNWVQGGRPAVLDKWTRARLALLGGVDLVLELPTVWAVSSAETFARGAVTILERSGVVDVLSFGASTETWKNSGALAASLNTPEYEERLQPVCGGMDALCRGQTGGGGQPAGGGAVPFALPAKQQSGGGVPADTGQPKQQDPAYDRPQGGSPT